MNLKLKEIPFVFILSLFLSLLFVSFDSILAFSSIDWRTILISLIILSLFYFKINFLSNFFFSVKAKYNLGFFYSLFFSFTIMLALMAYSYIKKDTQMVGPLIKNMVWWGSFVFIFGAIFSFVFNIFDKKIKDSVLKIVLHSVIMYGGMYIICYVVMFLQGLISIFSTPW